MSDSRRPEAYRGRDDRDPRDRGRGPGREAQRDSACNSSSSTFHLPQRLSDHSRTWDSTRDQRYAPHHNRPSSAQGVNTNVPARAHDDQTRERAPPKPAPEARPAPRTSAASQPEPTDLRGRLREKFRLEMEWKRLHATRDKFNQELNVAQSLLSRYGNAADFPPDMLEHSRVQQTKCIEELNSIGKQMGETEEQIMSLHQKLYPKPAATSSAPGTRSHPLDSNADKADLIAKLASLEESSKKALADHKASLEQQFAAMLDRCKSEMEALASNAQKDVFAMSQTYEAQISNLTTSLETESRRRTVLEKRLLAADQRIQQLGQKLSEMPQDCRLAEKTACDLARLETSYNAKVPDIDDLVVRLEGVSSSVSRLETTTKTLQESESTRQQMASEIQTLNDAVAMNTSLLEGLPLDSLSNLPTQTQVASLMQTVQQYQRQLSVQVPSLVGGTPVQLQSPTGSSRGTPDLPPSTERRLQQLEAEKQLRKAYLEEKIEVIGGFVQADRNKRAQLELLLTNQIHGVAERVQQLEEGQSTTKEEISSIRGKITFDFDDHRGKLVRMDRRLESLDQDVKGQSLLVHAQLQSLEAWQANFNTRPLYKDIVAHMHNLNTESLPKSVTNLTARVAMIEAYVRDNFKDKRRLDADCDDPSKRRRIGGTGNPALPA